MDENPLCVELYRSLMEPSGSEAPFCQFSRILVFEFQPRLLEGETRVPVKFGVLQHSGGGGRGGWFRFFSSDVEYSLGFIGVGP